jgi:SRSO17 transposase
MELAGMDEASFAGVEAEFVAFHRVFGAFFGRRESERRGEQYLRGLVVQRGERRNAENLAEAVEGATARALQYFLTEAPWETGPLIGRLQAYLGERLGTPEAVFVMDDSGFAKQGDKSVGVQRQYSGTLGKVGNCQVGVFLGYVAAGGHALVDARLYLPEAWTGDRARCRKAGVPDWVGFQTKPELALAMLRAARAAGHLPGGWVTADCGYGEVPSLRDALDAEGWRYVLEVPSNTLVFTAPARAEVPAGSGKGRVPTRARLVEGEAPPDTVAATAAGLAAADWRTLTVAEGAQGPRAYRFAALRAWECRAGVPGRAGWLVFRRNLDGSELKYYLSNAPAGTPLAELGRVGSVRWPIETEFQQGKGEVGLDEYEVRTWRGWHHHIALALLAAAFLLSLKLRWGGKGGAAPADAAPGAPGPERAPAPPHLDDRRPTALAGRHPTPQRARQAGPPQAPPRPRPRPDPSLITTHHNHPWL